MTGDIVWDELWNTPTERPTGTHAPAPAPAGTATPYANAALQNETQAVLDAIQGTRNHTLNRAGFSLAQLIAAGQIDRQLVHQTLQWAGLQAGLEPGEIAATLRSALGAGEQQPRIIPPRPEYDAPPVTVLEDTNTPAAETVPTSPQVTSAELADDMMTTWAAVDLTDVLTGTYEPIKATIAPRTDGQHLLYAGKVHSIHGESESGKSLVVQAIAAQLIADGGTCLYIDNESDKASVALRMIALGLDRDQVLERFSYVRPETDPRKFPHEKAAIAGLLANPVDLIVIDGVTDNLGLFGFATKDNDDIARWMKLLPRMCARLTGAAVVLIDHVTKDPDSRGRFAIGGQAKMAGLDGVAYILEPIAVIGQGLRGQLALRTGKDREGDVRGNSSPTWRKTDRTQETAIITVDSVKDPTHIDVTIDPPRTHTVTDDATGYARMRPTVLMERASRFIEQTVDPPSLRDIRDGVHGSSSYIGDAVSVLIAEGYVKAEPGARRRIGHHIIRPYRQVWDEQSDSFDPASLEDKDASGSEWFPSGSGTTQDRVVPGSPPLRGTGTTRTVEGTTQKPPVVPDQPEPHPSTSCRRCKTPITETESTEHHGLCFDCRPDNPQA